MRAFFFPSKSLVCCSSFSFFPLQAMIAIRGTAFLSLFSPRSIIQVVSSPSMCRGLDSASLNKLQTQRISSCSFTRELNQVGQEQLTVSNVSLRTAPALCVCVCSCRAKASEGGHRRWCRPWGEFQGQEQRQCEHFKVFGRKFGEGTSE